MQIHIFGLLRAVMQACYPRLWPCLQRCELSSSSRVERAGERENTRNNSPRTLSAMSSGGVCRQINAITWVKSAANKSSSWYPESGGRPGRLSSACLLTAKLEMINWPVITPLQPGRREVTCRSQTRSSVVVARRRETRRICNY